MESWLGFIKYDALLMIGYKKPPKKEGKCAHESISQRGSSFPSKTSRRRRKGGGSKAE